MQWEFNQLHQTPVSYTHLDQLMEDMNAAIGKARLKGAKDVVMIGKDAAFIVNVPNNVVVTAISSEEMKDNIFTNIDSAVIL